jgi:HD-GYP domain-containing protein (c-di-GMP phosphodiesterase class II)
MEQESFSFNEFLKTYFGLRQVKTELENELHHKQADISSWEKLLIKKSDILREQFKEDTALIDEYITPFLNGQKELTLDQAGSYMDLINSYFDEGNLDFLLMDDFPSQAVLPVFKKNHVSEEHMIALYAFLSGIKLDYLWSRKTKEGEEMSEVGLEYLKDFSLLPEESRRLLMIMIYNNFYSTMAYDLELRTFDFVGLKKRAEIFFARMEEIKPLLKSETEKKRYDTFLLDGFIGIVGFINTTNNREFYDERIQKVTGVQKEACDWLLQKAVDFLSMKKDDENDPNHLMIISHFIYASYLLKKISKDEFFLSISSLFEKRKNSQNKQLHGLYNSDALIYYLTVGIELSYYYAEEQDKDEEKRKKVLSLFDESIKYLASFSEEGSNVDLMHVTNDYLIDVLPLVQGEGDLTNRLLALLFYQQTSTLIHSKIVSMISKEIVSYMLSKDENAFSSSPCWAADWSKERKIKEAEDFILEASLLHDIGKTPLWDYVNLQKRRLTDSEFKIIKLHPRIGYELIRSNKELNKYADTALFHHKFYDGSKGYPEGSDNTSSPYRLFTDVVSIADSIDAGTDFLGRNYAVGKTFGTLLKELVEQEGTRYNPEIVDLIKEDMKLQEKLSYIVTIGRKKVFRLVYTDYINSFKKDI